MQKLDLLHAYLIELSKLPREQVHAQIEDGKLTPEYKNLGNSLQVGLFEYEATFYLESFHGSASILLAGLNFWLSTHDTDRERYNLADPSFSIEVLDRGIVDVSISISFIEQIVVVETENGELSHDGKNYEVNTKANNTAESGTVDDNRNR